MSLLLGSLAFALLGQVVGNTVQHNFSQLIARQFESSRTLPVVLVEQDLTTRVIGSYLDRIYTAVFSDSTTNCWQLPRKVLQLSLQASNEFLIDRFPGKCNAAQTPESSMQVLLQSRLDDCYFAKTQKTQMRTWLSRYTIFLCRLLINRNYDS
jgi:hypothetical protein